jgi:hypothetical protein
MNYHRQKKEVEEWAASKGLARPSGLSHLASSTPRNCASLWGCVLAVLFPMPIGLGAAGTDHLGKVLTYRHTLTSKHYDNFFYVGTILACDSRITPVSLVHTWPDAMTITLLDIRGRGARLLEQQITSPPLLFLTHLPRPLVCPSYFWGKCCV